MTGTIKTYRVTGNDRESATTGHGEAFTEEVEAASPAQAEAIVRRLRQRAGRHHILLGAVTEVREKHG